MNDSFRTFLSGRGETEIRYSLADCLQLTITLGAGGLLLRGFCDESLVAFFVAAAILYIMIGIFIVRVTRRQFEETRREESQS